MIEDISAHELLMQLKQGDINAADILYVRYAKEFYWTARRKGLSHVDAEDIVHTVFRQTIERIASYNEAIGGGEMWMRMICQHAISDVQRRKQTEEIPLDLIAPENEDPERYFEIQERLQNICRGWESISEADRQEIYRGRGRGPGRRAWHAAIQRFRDALDSL